jgi:hypothetical protein
MGATADIIDMGSGSIEATGDEDEWSIWHMELEELCGS